MPAQRLLILDDDPAIGMTMEAIAESSGVPTRRCTDAPSFFALLDSWRPTVIVLDLVMPDMDGVEVIVQLAERGCHAKLIISSGMDERVLDAARRSAAQHGLNIAAVLPKPFTPAQMRALLHPASPSAHGAHAAVTGGGAPAGQGATAPASGHRTHALSGDTRDALPEIDDLVQALRDGQLRVAYQPKVACADGHLTGLEVLARWRHPVLGDIAPDRFIAMAEAHGLINELTTQVLDLSLPWFARLQASYQRSLKMAINLSALSLSDRGLVDALTQRCQAHGVPARRVILELTETRAMEDPVSSLDLLTRFRMKGFLLSIDDFGTGYSSMLQLVRLPFSEIKIDKSFVVTHTPYPEATAVVRSIVQLARSLGMRCTAEGVEDAQTLEALRELGCDDAQGYHIARPMGGDAFLVWLKQGAVA